ncbi:unnamed protein product [marine sediment metagenome]|uniref:Uncharacterized protein n=1 Tax=marine sediment metagenome TaxID=412755 RepID=X1NQ30_9ZZZZ
MFPILEKEFKEGRNPININSYEQYILALLRRMSLEEISHIHGVNEGLENRIKRASLKSSSIEDLINQIKTRRYTRTKIQRILLHVMMNLSKDDVTTFNSHGPLYIRILGFSKKGKTLLRTIKKKSTLPQITKLSNYIKQINYHKNDKQKILLKMLNFDIVSTDIYTLGYQKTKDKVARFDFTHNIIIKDN